MQEEKFLEILKALELACGWIAEDHVGTVESWKEYFLLRARNEIN